MTALEICLGVAQCAMGGIQIGLAVMHGGLGVLQAALDSRRGEGDAQLEGGGEIERFRDQYDRIAAHWERIYQQGADVLALARMVKERAKHVGGGLRRLAGQ